MSEEPVFYRVAELAERLDRHIAVYDLEATTFRGRANFGITEVWCFIVTPKGPGVSFGGLVNPERAIDYKVQQLTGITQDMVRNQETWGERYADLFLKLAQGQCWVCGFNNSTFDNPAVKEVNERYGKPFEAFERTFDVRRLHLKLSNAESQAGSLEDTAAAYGIKPRGGLHRAEADVVLTLELLHAIIEVYGVEAVVNLILAKPAGATDKLSAAAIAKYAKTRPSLSLSQLATAFKKDAKSVSFELGKAIDERLVDPRIFADHPAQDWLEQAIPDVSAALLEQGKLKPIYDALYEEGAPATVDYVQLRIAMLNAGLSWTSLKPN